MAYNLENLIPDSFYRTSKQKLVHIKRYHGGFQATYIDGEEQILNNDIIQKEGLELIFPENESLSAEELDFIKQQTPKPDNSLLYLQNYPITIKPAFR